jgi:hypothetical protein
VLGASQACQEGHRFSVEPADVLLGRCIHWRYVDVWFHYVCAGTFERTAEGKALRELDKSAGPACSMCRQPLEEHVGRRACPNILGAGGR